MGIFHSQLKLIEDMQDEIRKLKAMIVKHEKRIRVLEARGADGDGDHATQPVVPASAATESPPQILVTSNNAHASEELAPDEV